MCAATGVRGLAQARGFAANGSAILWRTLCAATGGTGLAQDVQNAETVAANIVRHGRSSGEGRTGPAEMCAPPRFRGERVRILWRTLCAATGGTGLAQGVQNAETVAANIVRHGRSSGEGRTGPAGTCAPPRFHGARVRIFVANTVRRYGGDGVGAGPRFCGELVRVFVAHTVRRYGGYGVWRRSAVSRRTGRHFVAHAVRRYRAAGLRRTGRRRIFPAPVPIPLYTTKVEFRWSPGGVPMKILNNP